MKKYEAMFIIKPDLSEDERKTLLTQIGDQITKNDGNVGQSSIWAERKKLYFPIKKCREGTYYLLNFTLNAVSIDKIRQAYTLNENILRFLISALK
jgi:small subunit ribosomal protein S6